MFYLNTSKVLEQRFTSLNPDFSRNAAADNLRAARSST
jgi:hypothetical protein